MPRNKTGLFMGSTYVPVNRTVGDIQGVLVKAGARQISCDYDNSNEISGMRFSLPVKNNLIPFSLPVRIEKVFNHLQSQRSRQREKFTTDDRKQAQQIVWRQLLRWIEAQLAVIETGMVEAHQPFMPYAIDRTGKTMFELWNAQLALPAPEGKTK